MIELLNPIIEGLNKIGEIFCSFSSAMLIQSSVLIAALLFIDFLIRRRVRAVVRYCIWMLVLVKLVLPVSMKSPTSVAYWVADEWAAAPLAAVSPVSSTFTPLPPPADQRLRES